MCHLLSLEIKFLQIAKLGASPEVTDAIIAYAKKVCAEMGQPNANIMFGPNYNKIDFSRCVKTGGHKIEIIGRAPNATYIDCIGGLSNVNTIYTSTLLLPFCIILIFGLCKKKKSSEKKNINLKKNC